LARACQPLTSPASARKVSFTPSPDAAETTSGAAPAAFFKARSFFFISSLGTASAFDSAMISGLLASPAP